MLCNHLSLSQSITLYRQVLKDNDYKSMKRLCEEDLFFLINVGFKRKDINRQWLYERCREIEADPNEHLDLWAREHYKSTIITYALTIQDILKDPEVTCGIFSHTRPIAKGFLEQIKRELETNEFLKDLFPDVLYKSPHKESPKWSLDGGIIVKRKSNPKEATVEAWGLVDGQPTSKHFSRLIYDDVVTRESVTTPEQIHKVNEAVSLSFNLGTDGGIRRFIGTRYHANDTYAELIKRDTAKVRLHAATDDGTVLGVPVLLTPDKLEQKYKDMGAYVYSCQMLQNPLQDKAMGFKEEWLSYYDRLGKHTDYNYYILVDPASEKKKSNDYTVIQVIGLGIDNNYYLIDGVRDRLNLTERTNKLFEYVRKYKPLAVGYEKYGMQSDIEHIRYVMEQQNYRFLLVPLGGQMAKNDRIRRLVPIYEQRRFYLPHRLLYKDTEKKTRDFVNEFVEEEFKVFPVCKFDDAMDCQSRILDKDLNALFPTQVHNSHIEYIHSKPDMLETEWDLYA